MKLLQCILEKNRCYLAGKYIKPQGIVVHSTGANNPWLCRYVQPHAGQTTGLGGKTAAEGDGGRGGGAGQMWRRRQLEESSEKMGGGVGDGGGGCWPGG